MIVAIVLAFASAAGAQKIQKAVEAYNRGIELQESGDVQNALPAYDLAIQMDPRMAYPYNNRANLKLAMGDPRGAIADLTKVIELSPRHPLSYYNRGNIYLDLQQYD